MKNVALVGKFAAGKTTVANVLCDEHDYQRVSMAANMKYIVKEVYGTIDKAELVPVMHRDGTPYELSVREVLQKLGESVKEFDRDLWLRWLLNDIEYMMGPLVMDDTRLTFEVDALRERGWLIVKLEVPTDVRMKRYEAVHGRLPTLAEMSHISETQIDQIDPDLIVDGELAPELIADMILART
jgi:dephospho-CoA kinase